MTFAYDLQAVYKPDGTPTEFVWKFQEDCTRKGVGWWYQGKYGALYRDGVDAKRNNGFFNRNTRL